MLGIFDGYNDSVQRMQEYRPDGIDFLARSTDGHLDLPRAMDGGLVGGLFAMFVRPKRWWEITMSTSNCSPTGR
jgi:membrane dipeptidase